MSNFTLPSWILSSILTTVLVPAEASAQCLDWSPDFAPSGVQGDVKAMAIFDDGSGPALFVGGQFGTAGGLSINYIAKWNGTAWSPLGAGVNGNVYAMTVFDDGSGPALFVGGGFQMAGGAPANRIAKWNGATWSPLGAGVSAPVNALCVYDNGSGAALYVGGGFFEAGDDVVNNIAKWNGAHWLSLSGGIAGIVQALGVFDSGSGPELVAAGQFLQAGGVPAQNIARWNGASWSAFGSGLDDIAYAVTVLDDGGGSALYAGGTFTHADGDAANRIAKWNGSSWSNLGSGADDTVYALSGFDDGSGVELYAGGSFVTAGGIAAKHAARWDGAQWSALGSGLDVGVTTFGVVRALLAFTQGGAPALFVSGVITNAGGANTRGIAAWSGSNWSVLGNPVDNTLNAPIETMAVFDDGPGGTGPALYVGGYVVTAGGVTVNHVAKWNGTQWSALGSGADDRLAALAVFDDGSGAALYAAGPFSTIGGVPANRLAKWNGSSWSAVPGSETLDGYVLALRVFDDGSGEALYIGGNFNTIGGVSATNVVKWDGTTYTALGSGVDGLNPNSHVATFGVHDDGGGQALYAGGFFTEAGGAPAMNIAEWDGANWSALTTGTNTSPIGMASFDDGSGPALYVVGVFTLAGGIVVNHVARWDGTNWSAVGGGTNDYTYDVRAFDDGSGSALYVAGLFSTAGGVPAMRLAKWNGSSWSQVGGGLAPTNTSIFARVMAEFDDGSGGGPDLYVGGQFLSSGSLGAQNFAVWRGCGALIAAFCGGDGSSVPCPCGNNGLTGRGCENSAATGGAALAVSGTTQPDTIVLHATQELANALSIFLQGNAVIVGTAFGDGLRCTGGALKRLYVHNASSGAVDAPTGSDPSITARSAALGDPIAPGSTRYYQTYYRDPNLAYCTAPAGNSWNVTNGIKVTW